MGRNHYFLYRSICFLKGEHGQSHETEEKYALQDNASITLRDMEKKDMSIGGKDNSSCDDSTEPMTYPSEQKSPSAASNTELLTYPNVKHNDHDPYNHLERHDHHEVCNYNLCHVVSLLYLYTLSKLSYIPFFTQLLLSFSVFTRLLAMLET